MTLGSSGRPRRVEIGVTSRWSHLRYRQKINGKPPGKGVGRVCRNPLGPFLLTVAMPLWILFGGGWGGCDLSGESTNSQACHVVPQHGWVKTGRGITIADLLVCGSIFW